MSTDSTILILYKNEGNSTEKLIFQSDFLKFLGGYFELFFFSLSTIRVDDPENTLGISGT